MQESIFETVLTKLDAARGSWDEVAIGSGVPLRTLEKIGRRKTKNPGIAHVERLLVYFDRVGSGSSRLKTKRKAG